MKQTAADERNFVTKSQLDAADVNVSSGGNSFPINSSADEEGGTTSSWMIATRSIDKSLVDAAFIPDVGSNGCTTVLDAVGGFVAWPKNQVFFDPKATPPSTIQMIIVENKTAPKVPTKRKNFYVSSDAMQKEANKKRSQKALVY
ncbi:hypothetical protein Tco_1343716 [Tanacetum coccineum]